MRKLFAQPGFPRLFGGLSTSMLGDSVMLLVLSMWVKTLTGSNALAGLTFFWMVLPSLVAPLLGVWVDRFRRIPVLVWGNVVSAAALTPLLFVRDAGDVWMIWLVAAGYGVSFIVLPAALNGLLKEMVPDELLVAANSATLTTKEAFRLFGPLVGAALFATVGGWLVALVDAASFLVAAVAIAGLRVREEAPVRDEQHVLLQMREGFRHLSRDRVLGPVLVGLAMMTLVIGFMEGTIYALLDGFGKPATYAAAMTTAMGAGAVLGGLTATTLIRRASEVAVIAGSMVFVAVSVGLIAASQSWWLVLALSSLMGMALPALMIALNTLIQRRTPGRLMGRVSTSVEILFATPQAISLGLGSLLVVWLDWRLIFAFIAAGSALGALYVVWRLHDVLFRAVPSFEEDGEAAPLS